MPIIWRTTFLWESKKKKTNKNITKQERKGGKSSVSICTSLPVNFIDKILFRYGWLSFLKNSKIFWVFSPINDLFIFIIYLFLFFHCHDSKVVKRRFVAVDIVNCLESVKLNTFIIIFFFKWRYDRRIGNWNLSNCKLSRKIFGTSTGFEPIFINCLIFF